MSESCDLSGFTPLVQSTCSSELMAWGWGWTCAAGVDEGYEATEAVRNGFQRFPSCITTAFPTAATTAIENDYTTNHYRVFRAHTSPNRSQDHDDTCRLPLSCGRTRHLYPRPQTRVISTVVKQA